MNTRRTPRNRPSGFTKIEAVVALAVVAFLLAIVLPAVQSAREAARLMQCNSNLKQIGLALHNYAQANKVFPPGTVCTAAPIQPCNQYDVLTEAAQTGSGPQGTGFLLRVMPFIEGDYIARTWQWKEGICSTVESWSKWGGNYGLANMDVKGFYCPTRRSALRPGVDNAMMLSPAWTGGGTDYGGCAGRHAAFTLGTGYNLCDATMHSNPEFSTTGKYSLTADTAKERWGIFGRVNVSTQFKEVKDGVSNTIMIGELQRITDLTPTSKDGWVIGGPATLFTTGAMFGNKDFVTGPPVALSKDGKLMNNRFFGSPGSDHANGANFGLGDGSVQFFSDSMDPNVFALLGSMADGVAVDPYKP